MSPNAAAGEAAGGESGADAEGSKKATSNLPNEEIDVDNF